MQRFWRFPILSWQGTCYSVNNRPTPNSPASSADWQVSLRPDPGLLLALTAGGFVAATTGAVLLLALPRWQAWPELPAVASALAWLAGGGFGSWRFWQRSRDVVAFELAADGGGWLRFRGGSYRAVTLRAGSLPGHHFSWLRLCCRGGPPGLPFLARGNDSEAWRRLQVVLRHLGAVR